jgi:hypothetical protein
MERTYHALGTEHISDRGRRAFDCAFENGVLWNPQVFQILDAAARPIRPRLSVLDQMRETICRHPFD